jgi:hypothetical protein
MNKSEYYKIQVAREQKVGNLFQARLTVFLAADPNNRKGCFIRPSLQRKTQVLLGEALRRIWGLPFLTDEEVSWRYRSLSLTAADEDLLDEITSTTKASVVELIEWVLRQNGVHFEPSESILLDQIIPSKLTTQQEFMPDQNSTANTLSSSTEPGIFIEVKYDLFQDSYRAKVTIYLPAPDSPPTEDYLPPKCSGLHPLLVSWDTDLMGYRLNPEWGCSSDLAEGLMSYRLNPEWECSSVPVERKRYRERTQLILSRDVEDLEHKVDELIAESTAVIERVQRENMEKAIRMARLPKNQIIEIGLLTQTVLGQ